MTKTRPGQSCHSISVIIPVYKTSASLEKTLLSIAAQQSCGRAVTIVVANDGANAAVTEVCRRYGVLMVAIEPRRGSYFARNRALERASGELIVFLDSGITLPEDWLIQAISTLGTADYLACQIDIAEVPRPTAAEAYEKKNSYPISEYLRTFHFGVTGGLLVRRRLLEVIGGFDQRLHSGGDLEFGNRVFHASFKQVYLDDPVLLHQPRKAMAFYRKQFRVKIGHGQLARLYPGRFPVKTLRLAFFGLARALLPPRPASLVTSFAKAYSVPAWRRFFFLWILKICKASADLLAAIVITPRLPRKQVQIEWQHFANHGS